MEPARSSATVEPRYASRKKELGEEEEDFRAREAARMYELSTEEDQGMHQTRLRRSIPKLGLPRHDALSVNEKMIPARDVEK